MGRRKKNSLIREFAQESGVYGNLPPTPEDVASRQERTAQETEDGRKTRLLSDFDRIVLPGGGATAEQVRDTVHNTFNLVELEVFVYRLSERGNVSRSSYKDIADRLAETYNDHRINEDLVLLVAKNACQKIWNALNVQQQNAVRKHAQGTYQLPKRVRDFILAFIEA